MKNINAECDNFKSLINSWQDLQSSTINILISASKLMDFKLKEI